MGAQEVVSIRNRRGFTLLELSIVLAIIGTLIGGSLVILTGFLEASRVNATVERMDKIHKALLDYSIAFGKLPCPASLTLATTDTNFGVEAASNSSTCVGGTPAASFSSSGGAAEGALPTRTLRLPDDYMYDAWGRKFRYAINPARTAASSFPPPSGTQCTSNSDITVKDASGGNRTTKAVYVLMSHGANGHGGYTKNGAIFSAGSTNTDEQTNCHCDATGAAGTYSATYVQKLPAQSTSTLTDSFDDIVTFRDRWQLQSQNVAMASAESCGADIFVVTDVSPYLYTYSYSAGTFTALSAPSPTPSSGEMQMALAPSNDYVALVRTGGVSVYNVSGTTPSFVQDIATSGYAWQAAFSYDATYLAIVQNYSPTLRIFKKSGSTYSELVSALDANHNNVYSIAWSPDATYLAVETDVVGQFLYVYKRTADSFATLPSIPATSTNGVEYYPVKIAFSSDGTYLAVASTDNHIDILTRSGDTFSKTFTGSYPCGGGQIFWSHAGNYLARSDGCGSTIYSWNGTTLSSVYTPPTFYIEGFGPSDAYLVGWNGSDVATCTLASDKTSCSPTYSPSPVPTYSSYGGVRARDH